MPWAPRTEGRVGAQGVLCSAHACLTLFFTMVSRGRSCYPCLTDKHIEGQRRESHQLGNSRVRMIWTQDSLTLVIRLGVSVGLFPVMSW